MVASIRKCGSETDSIHTNAYAAFKRGDAEAEEIIDRATAIGLSVIVLGELLAGFNAGTRLQFNLDELQRFLASPGISIVSIDEAVARRYATLADSMRRKGKPIPTNDLWIAATALERGFDIFSYDAHFREVPGLIVGANWADFQGP